MTAPAKLTKTARQALFDRHAGQCPWCGFGMRFEDMHAHHRLLRSHGGTWALSNIVGVHRDCHTVLSKSIHQSPLRAYSLGFMVRTRMVAPSEIPLFDLSTGAHYLLDDNGKRYGLLYAEAMELLTAAGAMTGRLEVT